MGSTNACLLRKENQRGICQLPRMRKRKKANQQFGTPLVLLEWKGVRHAQSPTSTSSGSNQPWKRIQFSYSSIETSRLFLGNKYHSMKCYIRRCITIYSDVKHQKALYSFKKRDLGLSFWVEKICFPYVSDILMLRSEQKKKSTKKTRRNSAICFPYESDILMVRSEQKIKSTKKTRRNSEKKIVSAFEIFFPTLVCAHVTHTLHKWHIFGFIIRTFIKWVSLFCRQGYSKWVSGSVNSLFHPFVHVVN